MSAEAQEGYYGVGHDKWHQGFYSKLKRNDGRGSCCNLRQSHQLRAPYRYGRGKFNGQRWTRSRARHNNVLDLRALTHNRCRRLQILTLGGIETRVEAAGSEVILQ
jgi:hypothetical protein